MTFFAPSRDPDGWAKLQVLAFERWVILPGQTTISDNARKIPFDKKDASGQTGASTERKGQPIAGFTSTHLLSDEPWPTGSFTPPDDPTIVVDDFYQWGGAELLLRQAYAGEKPIALQVYHPDLERQGINAATVEEISGLTRNDDGTGTISIKWTEYRPPKATGGGGVKKGDQDEPDKKTATDDAIDKALDEIDRLQKEWKNL